MVGQEGYGERFVENLRSLHDGAEDVLVDILYALDFKCQFAIVTCLVGGLDMKIDKVVGLQCLECGMCLAGIVGVPEACGANNIYGLQSGITADATDEIYGGDDGTTLYLRGEALRKGHHLWAVSPTPWPDAADGVLPLLQSLGIEGMVLEENLALIDKFGEQACRLLGLGSIGTEHVLAPGLAGYVVRRGATQVLVASLDDKEVAILHTGIEMHALGTEFLLKVFYEYVGILCLQTATGVVAQQVAIQGDEVATQGKVVVSEFHANAGGLQRATTLVDQMLVITKDAAIGHLATGMEAICHGAQKATSAHACQTVEIGRMGMLEEGLSTQCLVVPVGHAIAKDNDMFHILKDRPSPLPLHKGGEYIVTGECG